MLQSYDLERNANEYQKKKEADEQARYAGFVNADELKEWRDAQSRERQMADIQNGEYNVTDDMLRRASDWNYGLEQGTKLFVDDPQMQELLKKRQALANGYDSTELGNFREEARGQIAGQRNNQQRTLSSNLGRGGVGGARAAAIKNTADQGYAKTTADAERKMAMDNSSMKRQGQNDLQDFIYRQKLGQLSTAAGAAQLGSADYGAQQAREANKGDSGACFITTAACEFYQLPDDCDELQTLRKFRDEVMLKDDKWKNDVKEYYELAKELAPKLGAVKDFHFWTDVFALIREAVGFVKAGKNQEAYDTYKILIEFVKGAF